jgi:hypothetical protein
METEHSQPGVAPALGAWWGLSSSQPCTALGRGLGICYWLAGLNGTGSPSARLRLDLVLLPRLRKESRVTSGSPSLETNQPHPSAPHTHPVCTSFPCRGPPARALPHPQGSGQPELHDDTLVLRAKGVSVGDWLLDPLCRPESWVQGQGCACPRLLHTRSEMRNVSPG